MQDQDARPLLVLMHGNRQVSTKNLARQRGRQVGARPGNGLAPAYLVAAPSPFGTRRAMPVFIEESILALPKILINGGRRGYLVGIDPQVCAQVLGARAVQCALVE
ncbi:MAG: hypothetical protein IPL15_23060 [Comamonadaceae bacterium]|nr:hypothetical protein [Comamonadaceae bacterium]